MKDVGTADRATTGPMSLLVSGLVFTFGVLLEWAAGRFA
jgi:hypothetical protein